MLASLTSGRFFFAQGLSFDKLISESQQVPCYTKFDIVFTTLKEDAYYANQPS